MKETKTCPYCGEEILAAAKKCKHCGEWLDKPVRPQKDCPTCGEAIDEEAEICPFCKEPTSENTENIRSGHSMKPKNEEPNRFLSNKWAGGVWKEFFLNPLIHHFADFKGRTSRRAYWFFLLLSIPILVIAALADNLFGWSFYVAGIPTGYGWTYLLTMLLLLLPGASAFVRRLHDIGKRGWWAFIGLVPLVGGIWLLVLLCRKGSEPAKNIRFAPLDAVVGALMFLLIASGLLLPKLTAQKLYQYDELAITCDGKFYVGSASSCPIPEATDLQGIDRLVVAPENKPQKLKSILSTSQFDFGMPSMFIKVLPSSVHPTVVYFDICDDMGIEYEAEPYQVDWKTLSLYGKIDIKTGKYELFPGRFIGLITKGSFKNCYLCKCQRTHYIFKQSPIGENSEPVASFNAKKYGVDSMDSEQLIGWIERQ